MKKKLFAIFLCAAILLTGCENARESSDKLQADSYNQTESVTNGSANYKSSLLDEAENDAMINEEAAQEPSNGESPEVVENVTQTESKQSDAVKDSKKKQKLVYSCDLQMETLNYDESMQAIKSQIAAYDGIIEQESQTDNDSYWYADKERNTATLHSYLVIRIPADHYQEFLESLNGNGKILRKDMQVENITKHYTEVETTIASLKTQENRLLEMMKQAKTVEDMITVETRLTEVQNQLAQYKNTLALLDNDVTYSTIRLTVDEVVRYVAKEDSFTDRLKKTFYDSGELFLSFLEASLFTLIMVGPIAVVLLIVLFILIAIIRRIRANRRKKKSKNHILNQRNVSENKQNDNDINTNNTENI